MKTLTTNSLFFGKYTYKVTFRVIGAYRWRYKPTKYLNRSLSNGLTELDKTNTDVFCEISEKYFNDSTIKTRIQHHLTSFYFKDESLVEKIKTELRPWIKEIHRPANNSDQEFLLNNPKKVVCDFYPKEKYRYCIYIKQNMPTTKRQSFYDWFVKNNNDKISVTGVTLSWLKQEKRYGVFYIRVEDEKTLLLVNMFLSEYIIKTVEYVLRDDINTQIGTE